MIVLTATVLKIVLDDKLADQIIAAWFVGQGFALQPYIQSYISGIVLRSNHDVFNVLNKDNDQSTSSGQFCIRYNDKIYKWKTQHILCLTLQEYKNRNFIVVPWTRLNDMEFVHVDQLLNE